MLVMYFTLITPGIVLHSCYSGVDKRQVVTLAAKTLAGQYRETIQRNMSVMEESVTL